MPLKDDKSNAFDFSIDEILKSGIYRQRHDLDIPMWEEALGWRFTKKGMSTPLQYGDYTDSGGWTIGSGDEPIRGSIALSEDDTIITYVGDLSVIESHRRDTDATDTVGSGYTLVESSEATTWDSGTTTWDSGNTEWDVGENKADQWSFEPFGTFVLATAGINKPQIKKGNINFNDLHDDSVSGATVNAGGSGYIVGETITGMAGGGGTGLDVTVLTVNSGAVTSFEITDFGSGFANGDTATGGTASASGTGFTCDVTVPDADFNTVEIFARLGPHMLAFNYTKDTGTFDTYFAWCSADDLDTWIAASTNTAGSLNIREASTGIRAVAPLANNLAVYTDNQMFLVSYVGQPNYFGYQPALEGDMVGALSKQSVVAVGRINYGVSREGFFATDGTRVERIGDVQGIDDDFKANVPQGRYEEATVAHYRKDNEIIFAFPNTFGTGVADTLEYRYNYKDKTWSHRHTFATHYGDSNVLDKLVVGFLLNVTDTAAVRCYPGTTLGIGLSGAITRGHDLGMPDRIKEVSSVRVGKQGDDDALVTLGWTEELYDDPTNEIAWGDSFLVDDSFKEFYPRTAGRYLYVKVEAGSAFDDFTLTRLKVQGRYEGSR